MPGLFVILSLAAVGAMFAMNAMGKAPSPNAPIPGSPGPDGDPPLGPAGPRLSSGKVTMPAGTKWMLDLTLNTPTTDRAGFEKFYASALAGQGKLLSTSWQDNQHLLTTVFVLQPQTLDLDSTLHDLFTVNSVQQFNTQLTLPSAPPSTNTISIPGSTVQIKAGETWILAVEFTISPGTSLDKASFENGMRQEIGNSATVTSMSWSGATLMVRLVYKTDDSFKIGDIGQTPTAKVAVKSATRVSS